MFILIAPMLELDKIQLAVSGKKESSTTVAPEQITIRVFKDNSIEFNHKIISLSQLLPLLREAKKAHPTSTPQLFHDSQAYFGTYQTVKNTVEEAGFEEMDVILQPR